MEYPQLCVYGYEWSKHDHLGHVFKRLGKLMLAILMELASLQIYITFEFVERLPKQLIFIQLTPQTKLNEQGDIDWYKVCLMTYNLKQRPSIAYNEYSASFISIIIMIIIVKSCSGGTSKNSMSNNSPKESTVSRRETRLSRVFGDPLKIVKKLESLLLS